MGVPPSALPCCGGVPGEDPKRKFDRRPRTGRPPAVLLPPPRPEPRIIVPRFEIDGIGFGVAARLLLLSLAPPLPGECDLDGVERWPVAVAVARFTDMTRTRISPVSTRYQVVNFTANSDTQSGEIETKYLDLFGARSGQVINDNCYLII